MVAVIFKSLTQPERFCTSPESTLGRALAEHLSTHSHRCEVDGGGEEVGEEGSLAAQHTPPHQLVAAGHGEGGVTPPGLGSQGARGVVVNSREPLVLSTSLYTLGSRAMYVTDTTISFMISLRVYL